MPIVAKSVILARAAALAAAAAAAAAGVSATPAGAHAVQARARTRVLPAASPVAEPAAAQPDHKKADYDVGYKKPPKKNQYKPGESGNKKGRPKGAKGLNTIVREVMTEKLAVRTPAGTKKMIKMEVQVRKRSELGLGGNLRAMDRIEALYQDAVPDEVALIAVAGPSAPSTPEQLDAVDQATWDALVTMLGAPASPGAERGEGQ